MKITIVSQPPVRAGKETYIVFLGKDEELTPFDKRDGWAVQARAREVFSGVFGEVAVLVSLEPESPRYVCIGAGDTAKMTPALWAQLVGIAGRIMQQKKISTYTFALPLWQQDVAQTVRRTIIALYAGTYRFDRYITDVSRKVTRPKAVQLYLPHDGALAAVSAARTEGIAVGEAADHARELGNTPPADMTPRHLAEEAKKALRGLQNVTVRVLGPTQLKKEKMGALLAVSQGSREDAQFIIMEYRGGKKSDRPIVFAGKAVTFDAGGLSIKPSQKLDEMKFDMLGGASVIALMRVIGLLGLPINVVGLVGATENVLGDAAYRPGDIVIAKNGKTIEILNTDAEGRVILADVLSYAAAYKPRVVVDVATLTGACVTALGDRYAGVFSREHDIAERLVVAGEESGDLIWRLPLDDEFGKNMQSSIADTRNIGLVSDGGASNGAAFLEHFVSYPWAHLDIAGTAWGSEKPFRAAGATGAHIDALVRFAESYI